MTHVKRILSHLFPKPRRPITWRSAIPLVVFLVLFAAICVFLEASGRMLFANRYGFLLLLVAPWIWWMSVAGHAGLPKFRGMLSLLVRLALIGLFAMLMSEPRSVRTSDKLSVMFSMDISDSIGEGSTDAALEFVSNVVTDKPEKDTAGLVVFGRNAAVELPPRINFPFEAINSRIDRDATNLAESLSLAAAMLPDEDRGRIVLISDGIQTEGAIAPVLDEIKSRGINIDVLPIEYQYDREVWLERLELPQFVKLGEAYEASVVLSSLQEGSGTLVLTENGQQIFSETVDFKKGKNRFVVPLQLRQPGYYEYAATINVERSVDHLKNNNTVLNYIYIEGEGKILLVRDPEGEDRDWSNLRETLKDGKRVVDVMDGYDLPRDALSLMPYDCIVFANVPADAIDTSQMKAVHDAVFDLGIGFLMVGGDNSFGPGGYHRTEIEDALPVSMDVSQKKIMPKGALAIILHTCEFAEGNTWGKRITKQAIKVLSDEDDVGVLVYGSGGEKWLFEPMPAGDYEKMVPKINAANIGDMPSFATTMQLGLDGLIKNDAATKHMIIISDGDPSPPPPAMIDKFIANKISISMVAIFPHGGQEISKMRSIAGVTGGRYYFPSDPNTLPSIFIKEAKTLRRSLIQNKTISPEMGYPSPVLKGVTGVPDLEGYVLTSAKARASVALQVTMQNEDGQDEVDPILAHWRYGLGTTAAFTSDFSTNWGKQWMAWEQRQALLNQLVTQISRVKKQGHLRMWNYVQGNEGVVVVEDFHPEESFLEITARVSGPRDRTEQVTLKQLGPRRYQATVPLWGKGRYQVMALGTSGDRTDRATGGLILPYSPEYLRFRSDPITLDTITTRTEGKELDASSTAEQIFGDREPKTSSRQIFDWFLISLACLIPLDVGLRRVQLDPWAIKEMLGFGKKAKATATMGTLLDRKRDVSSKLKGDAEAKAKLRKPTTTSPARSYSRATNAPKTTPKPEAPKPETQVDPENLSTTERLLRMKQKRDDGDDK